MSYDSRKTRSPDDELFRGLPYRDEPHEEEEPEEDSMTQSTPSPLPWQIDDDGDIVDANNRLALDGHFSRPDELSRVVRAVNREPAYAAMIEALKPFAAYADPHNKVPGNLQITNGSVMAKKQLAMSDCYKARAALALAEERE